MVFVRTSGLIEVTENSDNGLMKNENLHPQESLRLQALSSLKIMDTISEHEFDEITLIASQICGTPIALISLLDDKRQWFKSRVGMTTDETSRDAAFCAHAILQDDLFEISDATKDDRFNKNPLVLGSPHMRFYAGVPVLDPTTGLPLGTLCVIDSRVRKLTAEQRLVMISLSRQINKLLEFRQHVAALAQANEDLQFQKTAFNHITVGVVLRNHEGKIIDFNPASCEVLGLTSEELLGTTSVSQEWNLLKEGGDHFQVREQASQLALATGAPQKNILMGIKLKSGAERWMNVNAIPLFLKGPSERPSHVVTTFSDITQQRRAQTALFQQSQLASLGEMAGGVAHEINTPLAIISAAASQAKRYLQSEPPAIQQALEKIGKITATNDRVAKIVKGMRTLARDSSQDTWTSCSLRQLIEDAIALCQEKFKSHDVKIHLGIDTDSKVVCSATQMSQVIVNLLNNSFDAIRDFADRWVEISFSQEGDRGILHFKDCGNGIPADVREKMMSPFFTTKEVGQGTGLGLSISKRIVESFDGVFRYDHESPNTCFVLEFPLAPSAAVKAVA